MPLADVSDVTIAAEVWLATAAEVLAAFQVLTGARMFGRSGGSMSPAIVTGHNAEGVTAYVAPIAG